MAGHKMISLLVVGLLFAANLHLSEAQVGVFYSANGDNLPAPKDVVGLLTSNKISRVRLLPEDEKVLTALKGTNIEVSLTLTTDDILNFGLNTQAATNLVESWVTSKVGSYPDVKIKYIVLGTDISRNNKNNQLSFAVPRVMEKINKALQKGGFKDIKVTTSCDMSIFKQSEANPAPSTAQLLKESFEFLNDTLQILKQNGAPFMVNMSPYYELINHPNEIKLDFALFTATGNVLTDGKLGYQNKFDAMLDSFYTALEKSGYPEMEIIVAETGWPSTGGVHATIENAKTYVTNLVQHVKKGTPKRPNKPIQVYVNLFDDSTKDGPEIEKHFGVFTSDKKIKFPVAFTPSA